MPDDVSPAADSFVERHGLNTPERRAAIDDIGLRMERDGIDVVRLVFVDQHGLLRGKTVVAAELPRVCSEGCGAPSSLLLKDTSNRTVFATFSAGAGIGFEEMQGAADMLMVPDPQTFRVLPWAPHSGWLLCDLWFTNGRQIPFSTRSLFRATLDRLAERGYEFVAGAELEFHLFRLSDDRLRPDDAGQPGTAPEVTLTTQGYQYLSELRYDELDPLYESLRKGLQGLGLPLCSLEVEFGPSQCEITFRPAVGVDAADLVVLARSAVKQIARRLGYHATFMCRPRIPNVVSSGWHLHQSLRHRGTTANAFQSSDPSEILSPLGRSYLSGLLDHARAAAAFSTPTINGYKRYRPYSLAPDRAIWGRDNRGAMVRVVGDSGSSATRLENRIGEPAANPYLYMASQIVTGFDGVDRELELGPSADTPYETHAARLPGSLEEALAALDDDICLRTGFGQPFISYWTHLKRAELARFHAQVSDWEQQEYFSMF
ncbi:glutamine synthetase family protein [Telmatospirillum siberiense]|uniref:Glutamine synthetase n=1 Tax=Telmatospirillum siberiense TaxID=382514 RepID=A0A2N3PPU7_9PROT|nr:glutamine synthetase family protein [Telmatospirillum siberiense]PKU22408.1 glutamine synthetase [Telmatospirillum siberiense]